jgi:hypothetical protein
MITKRLVVLLALGLLTINVLLPSQARAATPIPDAGLSLEVSPSPLVQTVKPGEQKSLAISIFNAGSTTENLKITLQSFRVDTSNGKVTLQSTAPAEIADWVSFPHPSFSIKAGERISEQVNIKTPASAGFSYNFAMVISRQVPLKATTGQSAIQGSVAIFTLLNIDRPGATKKLEIASLKTTKGFYEYLPAKLSLTLRNTGNSLLLPAGNVYIQRSIDSNTPISVLPLNSRSLYLLPGVTREYQVAWSDGLPAYHTTQVAANGAPEQHLEWNWRDSHFRVGRYVARVVVIYNDGHRDIPLQDEVAFWVIPWKILGGGLIGFAILLIGVYVIVRFLARSARRNHHKSPKHRA